MAGIEVESGLIYCTSSCRSTLRSMWPTRATRRRTRGSDPVEAITKNRLLNQIFAQSTPDEHIALL